jgi:hypothetical protein
MRKKLAVCMYGYRGIIKIRSVDLPGSQHSRYFDAFININLPLTLKKKIFKIILLVFLFFIYLKRLASLSDSSSVSTSFSLTGPLTLRMI